MERQGLGNGKAAPFPSRLVHEGQTVGADAFARAIELPDQMAAVVPHKQMLTRHCRRPMIARREELWE